MIRKEVIDKIEGLKELKKSKLNDLEHLEEKLQYYIRELEVVKLKPGDICDDCGKKDAVFVVEGCKNKDLLRLCQRCKKIHEERINPEYRLECPNCCCVLYV